ncbi:hypothetical protein F0562_021186 [Nyssa sinensis]|uniref:Fungal lipase-type domain-containing protein n=1 Tax=Nyssa sinensis TaxID=561372 RepID=A0A5J5BKG0_9ASTE|nr:hypothetical protein F0562_021186 [Nyssa sinensis]
MSFVSTVTELDPEKQQRADQRQLADCWRDIHGKDAWVGMLDPVDPLLRAELIRYGEMTQVCYDALESQPFSKNFGACKFTSSDLFESLKMENPGYEVTLFLKSKISRSRKILGKPAKWMGYVGVSNDEKSKHLGRRDIAIAWRGTSTFSEWMTDFKNVLVSISPDQDPKVKVELGFLHLYTDKDETCEDSKYSVREQILNEVKRLIQMYRDEELSISITGHSLGSALAMLSAHDIVERGLNMTDVGRVLPVCVFSFSGPRVGNVRFKEKLEELGVKVLRVVNVNDIVPTLPGVLFNEKLPTKIMKLFKRLPWSYTHVGVEFTVVLYTYKIIKLVFVKYHYRARSKQMQQLANCWRRINCEDDWKKMLDPSDPRLCRELIRYGEMAKSCYDAFESSHFSDKFGNCKFTPSNLFESLKMGNLGYTVSAFLCAASNESSWRRFSKNSEKWIGYVAVSNDETSKHLGYRDITIAWRGTKSMSE